ncbi:phospholipase D [Pseudovirgaria hyperparasitica]|uniref:Phospholipase D1 n=1 Tax=Pseudovirgaria hyperparasitica TaxID=470096 RepID=A0A6A6WJM4_9PEZI|nr:phospholipase D [Pseudovirgaria hyperparasitica]KAF2762475.1 phospholipase D [Pseudovirgaria hyperparasitica]
MATSPDAVSPLTSPNAQRDNSARQTAPSQRTLQPSIVRENKGTKNEDLPLPETPGSVKFVSQLTEPQEFPFPHGRASNSAPDVVEGRYDGGIDSRPASKPPSLAPPSRKATNQSEIESVDRRSVQFASSRSETFEQGHSRNQSREVGDADAGSKQGQSLLSKLKALATPTAMQTHGRTFSSFTIAGPTIEEKPPGLGTPLYERDQPYFPTGDGNEADAEESGGEGPSDLRTRRRSRRPWNPEGGTHTAPTTPKAASKMSSFLRDSPTITPTSPRPMFGRRATMTDIPENQRVGVSEDEGRDRIAKKSAWARGMNSAARGLTYTRRNENLETPEGRRPMNLRRFTGMGSNPQGTEASPSAWRLRGERTSSISAQKWRQLKAGLKMLGQKRKEENKVDHAKSAELMAELLAGAPAALLLASMFQRDEHGHKRIPILLEQLKIRIADSERIENKGGDRHVLFRIELEYGSGLTRMKWVIHRTLRDFANLHIKYKLQAQSDKYLSLGLKDSSKNELPRFPRSALPYLRGMRGLVDDGEEEEEEEEFGVTSAPEGEASGPEGPQRPHRRRQRSSFAFARRKSSISGPQTPGLGAETARNGSVAGVLTSASATAGGRKETYAERQRKKLQIYLQQLIAYFIFRADSNRLCKFLELSALGVRLATEGGYHGKEGLMVIQSGKGIDFRRAWNPALVAARHSPKWFLVRHSYIVCVDSPEEMNVYDVFLVDSDFKLDTIKKRLRDSKPQEIASKAKASATHPKHHQLKVSNSERKIKLLARNERQLQQFEDSIKFMVSLTDWAKEHRFGSFAPVRHNVFAQWLVDGRDYMWNVSRAISMARDVIYIHDWWLSPELYMRRPAAISQKWRLDRLLQRKAQEGVKVFVIMYRNINTAIPIDSEYSKFSLLDLHPNVFVQRSPNHLRQNTFFWAHHEKICIIDHTVAFCGGIDLCFGRWDTPQHSVIDDKLTGFELSDAPKDADHCQLWPGKDYSNPRVQDFYNLDKPYEEMYDRAKVPRMPWHDIGMQIVGQPARDLTRHFVQRWNYILRQRKPSRPTPFLLPPPDFNPADLEALGLDGTCEVQMLRSACSWSMGTPNRVEDSIMQAYMKMIQTSDHFVYIENQFFISSCTIEGTKMQNHIGDALVERIKRAERNDEDWRAVIVIPLMPGFQSTVDSQDGSSVRLIMTCQYRSICRGPTSIFGRLRAAGIEPEDYIQFYALRSWGKIGPNKTLVTEQLYIHAKCMVVDDRVAIIGSANINERSMLGSRDSEVAAIVRDTELIDSYMAGQPYKVGKFAHTLRMRLMREHLGIDVDELMEEECQSEQWEREQAEFNSEASIPSSPASDKLTEQKLIESQHRVQDELIAKADRLHSFNHDVDWEQENNPHLIANKKVTADSRVTRNEEHERDVRGEGADNMLKVMQRPEFLGRDSQITDNGREVLVSNIAAEGRPVGSVPSPKRHRKTRDRSNTVKTATSGSSAKTVPNGNATLPPPQVQRMLTEALGLPHLSTLPALPPMDDSDIGGPPLQRSFSGATARLVNPLISEMRRPIVTPDCMRDPVADNFFLDTWHQIAENNTKLFRLVFRCQPDNEVRTWDEYKAYNAFSERFSQSQGAGKSTARRQHENSTRATGPPGGDKTHIAQVPGNLEKKAEALNEHIHDKIEHRNPHHPMGKVETWAAEQQDEALRGSTPTTGGKDEHLDEKAALRQSNSNSTHDTQATTDTTTFPPPPPIPEDDAFALRNRAVTYSEDAKPIGTSGSQKRRRRATTKSSAKAFSATDNDLMLDKEDAEVLLNMVQGHLISWPYDWLEKEERGSGWLYTVDQIAPLEIYS